MISFEIDRFQLVLSYFRLCSALSLLTYLFTFFCFVDKKFLSLITQMTAHLLQDRKYVMMLLVMDEQRPRHERLSFFNPEQIAALLVELSSGQYQLG